MNKVQLVEKMAQEARTNKAQAARSLRAVVNSVTESLKAGQQITITGLGTFRVKTRAPRKGRNPRTGQALDIPAVKAPSFKASVTLKKAIR